MAAPRRSAKETADPADEAAEHDKVAEPIEEEAGTPEPSASDLTDLERAYMNALQRERAGYERRGMKDRVAQVDAELKRLSR